MGNILKPAAVLLIICLGVGLCLAAVDSMTKDVIEQRANQDAESKRKEVLSEAESFEKISGWEGKASDNGLVKEVYRAVASGKTKGYVFSVFPKGYAGNIQVTVGVNLEGKITGVKIGENKETPGLGSKASEPAFLGQFTNKVMDKKLEVVKKATSQNSEIQAISGATISSKAVTSGVQAASDLAKILLKEEGGAK